MAQTYPDTWPQKLKCKLDSDEGSCSSGGLGAGEFRALRYQPKTPAAHTMTIVPRLKMIVCRLDWGWGLTAITLFRRPDVGSSWSGVTGERWVPSIDRKRSRNEPWEWPDPRRSISEMRGRCTSIPLPLLLVYGDPFDCGLRSGRSGDCSLATLLSSSESGFLYSSCNVKPLYQKHWRSKTMSASV